MRDSGPDASVLAGEEVGPVAERLSVRTLEDGLPIHGDVLAFVKRDKYGKAVVIRVAAIFGQAEAIVNLSDSPAGGGSEMLFGYVCDRRMVPAAERIGIGALEYAGAEREAENNLFHNANLKSCFIFTKSARTRKTHNNIP